MSRQPPAPNLQVLLITEDKRFTQRAGEHGLQCAGVEGMLAAVQAALRSSSGGRGSGGTSRSSRRW